MEKETLFTKQDIAKWNSLKEDLKEDVRRLTEENKLLKISGGRKSRLVEDIYNELNITEESIGKPIGKGYFLYLLSNISLFHLLESIKEMKKK